MTDQHECPVGVVITAYNGANFVAEAIRSVQAQTRPPREILVVDDGSTDATAEIAAGFGVRVLRQANAGSAAARNAGLRAVELPWVAFLDVDDRWKPRKLQWQWEALQREPAAAFAVSDYLTFDADGVLIPAYLAAWADYASLERRQLTRHAVAPDPVGFAQALVRANFLLPSTLLVRRDVMLALGGFDPTLRRCEDYDFFLRLAHASTGVVVEDPVLDYRVHDASKSSTWHLSLLASNTIGERIAAHPERYPAGAPEAFAARRVPAMNAAAKYLLRNQRYRDARETALRGLREVPSLPGATTIALSYALGLRPLTRVHSALRAYKQRRARRERLRTLGYVREQTVTS